MSRHSLSSSSDRLSVARRAGGFGDSTFLGDLHGLPAEGGNPIRLERRGGERWAAEGGAIVVFRHEDGSAGITPVDLVDLSASGAAVMTDLEIEPGTTVAFCGGDAALAGRSAVVTRSVQTRLGVKMGLRFHSNNAA